jgi:hypothetical protein
MRQARRATLKTSLEREPGQKGRGRRASWRCPHLRQQGDHLLLRPQGVGQLHLQKVPQLALGLGIQHI